MLGRPAESQQLQLSNGTPDSKKKRGRPRTLDGREDEDPGCFAPRISAVSGGLQAGLNGGLAGLRPGSQSPVLAWPAAARQNRYTVTCHLPPSASQPSK